MIKIKYSSENVVATHDDNPPGGRSLYMTGSLFLGSTEKHPVTEVTNERESTSYSGAGY